MNSAIVHLSIGLILGCFFCTCVFVFYYKFLLCKHEYVVVKEVSLFEKSSSLSYGLSVIKQCRKCGNIKHKSIMY